MIPFDYAWNSRCFTGEERFAFYVLIVSAINDWRRLRQQQNYVFQIYRSTHSNNINRLKCHTRAMHLKIGPDSAIRHLSQSLLAPFGRKLCFVRRAERWLFYAPIYIFFANLKPTFPFTTFNCERNATVTSSTAVRYLFSWLHVSAGIRTRNTLCH